jgi:hypothetical protein
MGKAHRQRLLNGHRDETVCLGRPANISESAAPDEIRQGPMLDIDARSLKKR